MKHFFLFLLLIPTLIFCVSPRLMIIIGDNSGFTAEELKKQIHATILTGSSDEIKQAIRLHDQFQCNHIFIIKSAIQGLSKFAHEVGFEVLLVNKDLQSAIDRINQKIEMMPQTDADLPHMNPRTVGLFYSLLETVDEIFAEKEIHYWITAGTLLGSVRHKGMIPWDDDLDIGIFEEDVEKLFSIQNELDTFGLELCKHTHGLYKIYPKKGKTIDNRMGGEYTWKYPFLDIFVYTREEDKFLYQNTKFRQNWPCEYHLYSELSIPFEKGQLGPLKVPIPHESRKILTRFYGFDWEKVTYIKWNHQDEKKVKKVKVELKNFDPPHYIMPKNKDFTFVDGS